MSRAAAVRLHQQLAAVANGPGYFPTKVLPELVGALIDIHAPAPSRSIDTLACEEHNVTKGDNYRRISAHDVDFDACPDCLVTLITVCKSWACERYPCETIQAVAEALGLDEEAQ